MLTAITTFCKQHCCGSFNFSQFHSFMYLSIQNLDLESLLSIVAGFCLSSLSKNWSAPKDQQHKLEHKHLQFHSLPCPPAPGDAEWEPSKIRTALFHYTLIFINLYIHLNSSHFVIISYSQTLQGAKIKHQQIKRMLSKSEHLILHKYLILADSRIYSSGK